VVVFSNFLNFQTGFQRFSEAAKECQTSHNFTIESVQG
jgi:hypothetical protein